MASLLTFSLSGQVSAQSGLAASSWPSARHDSQLRGRALVNGPSAPRIRFATTVGAGALGDPVVGEDGTVYVSGRVDNKLYALTPAGNLKWTFAGHIPPPKQEFFMAPPAIMRDGTLLIASTDTICTKDKPGEFFYAINPDGTLRWKKELEGGTVFAANVGSNDSIYVVTDFCWLYSLDPRGYLASPDTIVNWRTNLRALPENAAAINLSDLPVVVAGDTVMTILRYGSFRFKRNYTPGDTLQGLVVDEAGNLYLTTRDHGRVLSVSATGALRWLREPDASFGIPALPALGDDGTLYLTSLQGGWLLALDTSTGAERWRKQLPGGDFISPAVLDAAGHLYAVHSTEGLVCLAADGTLRWSRPEVRGSPGTSPAFGADGTIYVSGDRTLYAIGQSSTIQVSPAVLEFGQVCLNTATTTAFTIENLSSDPVVISSIISDHPALSLISPLPRTLPPHSEDTLRVALVLSRTGAFTANLTISSSSGEQVILPVTAEGVEPQIALEAHPPDFGEICAGEEVSAEVFIINPSATCSLRVDSFAVAFSMTPRKGLASEQPAEAAATPFFIAPQDTFKLIISTVQNSPGAFEAKVTVWSNAGGPKEIKIPGTVVPPKIAGTDTRDFGRVPVSQTRTDSVLVWNDGRCELKISEFLLRGPDSASFALATVPPQRTLQAGDTLSLRVTFTPARAGIHVAQLLVISDAEPDTLVIELRGTGVPPGPIMVLGPPDTLVLKTCLTDTTTGYIKIRNVGAGDLIINSVLIDNPAFALAVRPVFPIKIQGSEEYQLAIRFAAPALGEYRGLLTVSSNDTTSDSTVELIGRVNGPEARLSADPSAYGDVCVGTPATSHVCIKNPTGCELLIDRIVFIFTEGGVARLLAPELPLTASTPPIVISPGDSLCFPVSVTPGTAGSFQVEVRVVSNAVNADTSITITGTAISPVIAGADTVNFGAVVVGNSKKKEAPVWNAGECPIKIDSLVVTGTDASYFTVGPITLPISLAKGDTAKIPVTFSPTKAREYAATLLVYSNGLPNPLRIALRGVGVPQPPVPDIKVEPLALDFGNVFLTNDSTLIVTVSNEGGLELTVHSPKIIGDSAFTAPLDSFNLQPGASRMLPVTFAPSDTGDFPAQLWIMSTDPDAEEDTVVVSMRGRGISPVSAPKGVAFEKVCLGESGRQTITITNHGSKEIAADTLFFTAGLPEFKVEPVNDFRVPAGGTNTLEITFTPRTVDPVFDTLRIPWRQVEGVKIPATSIAVSGSGVAGQLIAGDSVVVFPDTKIGETAVRSYVIHNVGTCSLRVNSLWITGAGFTLDPAPDVPIVIAKGGSYLVNNIKFSPDTTGLYEGVLHIVHNDLPHNPKLVKLQGKGTSVNITIVPNPKVFRQVDVGASECDSVEVINQGTENLIVDIVYTTSSPRLAFFVEQDEFQLLPGAHKKIEVCFTPPDTGTYRGTLALRDRDGRTFPATLIGRGMAAYISVNPASLKFEDVPTKTTAVRQFVISNKGNKALAINEIRVSPPYRVKHPSEYPPIPPFDGIEITVEFTPPEDREYQDSLVILSNAHNGRGLPVPLDGRGFTEQPPVVCLRASAASLDFGRVRVRHDSIRTVELINCGEVALDVDRPGVASQHFEILEPGGAFTLQPNEVKSVRVRFHPQIAGPKGDELVINAHDSLDRPVTEDVNLTGDGRPNPNIAVRVTPAIFTPNGDTYNDRVKFDYKDFEVTEPVLRVFNIRGAVVATLELDDKGEYYWDGHDRQKGGKPLAAGIYLWLIEDGGKKLGSGYISLVR
ncbi:choice-of-anchor D domain-containing protein [bacterium]|nr:choice-of-anchor D domain-containing protein [bacterium]